jgi:hypothetical protein
MSPKVYMEFILFEARKPGGGEVSRAKPVRVKHASPMKQEPTEVILQDE